MFLAKWHFANIPKIYRFSAIYFWYICKTFGIFAKFLVYLVFLLQKIAIF